MSELVFAWWMRSAGECWPTNQHTTRFTQSQHKYTCMKHGHGMGKHERRKKSSGAKRQHQQQQQPKRNYATRYYKIRKSRWKRCARTHNTHTHTHSTHEKKHMRETCTIGTYIRVQTKRNGGDFSCARARSSLLRQTKTIGFYLLCSKPIQQCVVCSYVV